MSEVEILGKLILEELKLIRKDMKVEVRKLLDELKSAYSLNKQSLHEQQENSLENEENFQNKHISMSTNKSGNSIAMICENLSKTNYGITERLAVSKKRLYSSNKDREFDLNTTKKLRTPNCKVKMENPLNLMSYDVGIDVSECFSGLEKPDDNTSASFSNPISELENDSGGQSISGCHLDAPTHLEIRDICSIMPEYSTTNNCHTSHVQNSSSGDASSIPEMISCRRQSMPVLPATMNHQSHDISFEENFKCQYCRKPFRHFSSYESHLRTHTGEKPFSCPICYKPFAQKGNLKTHMLIHASERPHVCNICNRSFAQKGNLKSHLLLHKKEPLFQCETCKKSFKSHMLLSAHASVHT